MAPSNPSFSLHLEVLVWTSLGRLFIKHSLALTLKVDEEEDFHVRITHDALYDLS